MATTTSIRGLLTLLNEYQTQLDQGDLRLEELDHLVLNSQELLERYIVLRYKAYEGMATTATIAEPTIEVENSEDIMAESDAHEQLHLETPELDLNDQEDPIAEDAPVAFDFSLFDSPNDDLIETPIEEEIVEHISVSATTEEDQGVIEEKVVIEHHSQTPEADENKAFIHQFSHIDAGFFSQIGMSRLDSLVGSFGLNERLQYINELFNGSSEAFSDAVKRLDHFASYEDALIEASKFAHEYQWDLESDTVEELVTKLKRRHG